jgi:periplasmic divalent cation tolerance protein
LPPCTNGGSVAGVNDAILVLITAPDEAKAAELARSLVEARLAACGNIVPRIRSIYRWEGKVEDEAESLLLLKTRRPLFEALKAHVLKLHPYDVPMVESVAIEASHAPYLEWLATSTSPSQT